MASQIVHKSVEFSGVGLFVQDLLICSLCIIHKQGLGGEHATVWESSLRSYDNLPIMRKGVAPARNTKVIPQYPITPKAVISDMNTVSKPAIPSHGLLSTQSAITQATGQKMKSAQIVTIPRSIKSVVVASIS